MPVLLASIPFPNLDPVIFQFGPLALRWYGLAYVLGFILGYLGLRRLSRTGRLHPRPSQLPDLLTWLILGVLLGGRLGWWLIYRPAGMPTTWYEPLAIWHGGMSFHGGLLGVAIALLLWSWRHRVGLWNLADALALVTPIGLFFGRLANFINAELVGRPTDLPWGVIFPGETFARHPSQLYEALLEGPLLVVILWAAQPWARHHPGRSAALFLTLYGLFRFLVEFTREPDPQLGFIAFGWLTMGQLLSLALLLLGLILLSTLRLLAPESRVP